MVIEAPCSANYFQNLPNHHPIALYLDTLTTLTVSFADDAHAHSWRQICGPILRAFLRSAPPFITYNENSQNIEIRP
jgi:hypothetical protein